MNWYEIINVDSIDSPSLVIYKERVNENIRLLKGMVNNEVSRLRPHVKTNKIPEVCRMMMEAGISKFKCATIAEAEMLAMNGAPDVLFSYQPVGPKARRFINLVIQYPSTHFSCLVDNIQPAEHLSELCSAFKISVDVFIDLNTGMNRTGILPSRALLLFEAIELLPAVNVIGLHAYDGHIHHSDPLSRKKQVDFEYSKVVILEETIKAVSNKKLILVAGGTPTFPIFARHDNIECSPGTFIFWDWGYKQAFPDEPFDFAALVITRVISIVDEQTITTDLGHKSVAAENPLPRVHFLNAPGIQPFSQSEEHLVLKVGDSSLFNPGDVLYGVPVHICPTVALYEKASIIEKNTAVDEWKVIGRYRTITI